MATKNIQMNLYNGSDYDVLYPQTTASQAGAVPTTRTVNSKALSSNITLSASDVSAVPTTRTVNGKALSSNITLSASDVSALPLSGGTLTGDLTIKGSSNYGTKINLGDGDYVHISEPTDDCMEIKAKKVNIVTTDTSSTGLTWNSNAIGGSSISTPVSIANGGTGSSTASGAIYGLTNGLTARTAANINSYASSTYIPCYYSSTGYKMPVSALATYIQNQASGSGGNSDSAKLEIVEKIVSSTSTSYSVTFSQITPKAIMISTKDLGQSCGPSGSGLYCGPSANIGDFTISGKVVSFSISGGSYAGLFKSGTFLILGFSY